MSMIYLVGNGISDYISQIKIENKKYVGCVDQRKRIVTLT